MKKKLYESDLSKGATPVTQKNQSFVDTAGLSSYMPSDISGSKKQKRNKKDKTPPRPSLRKKNPRELMTLDRGGSILEDYMKKKERIM